MANKSKGITDLVILSTGMVTIPPRVGGAVESYVMDILRMFQNDSRFRLHVISNYYATRVNKLNASNVTYVRSNSPVNKFPLSPFDSMLAHLVGGTSTVAAALRYSMRLRNCKNVVWHFNEEISASIRNVIRDAKKSILTIHNPPPGVGGIVYDRREDIIRKAGTALCISAARRADHVIVPNPMIMDYVISRGVDESKVTAVPLPVDTSRFMPVNLDRERRGKILFVGRLESRKNVMLLLRAMRYLPEEINLMIVGDGNLKKTILDYIASRNLQSRVNLVSGISSTDLIRIYQDSIAFVFPSLLECYPRVVVEASACGLPVVLPALEIYRHFIEGGFVKTFEPNDPVDLADTIVDLVFSDQQVLQLGRLARNFAVSNCSLDTVREKLSEIYIGVLTN